MFRPLATALLLLMLAATVAAQDDKIPFQVLSLPPTLGLPDSHAEFCHSIRATMGHLGGQSDRSRRAFATDRF